MKKYFLLLLVFLISCSSVNPSINNNETEYDKKAIELQKIIAEIQSALSLVNDDIEKDTNLKLDKASLQVNAEIKKSADGSADLWVFSGKIGIDDKTYDRVSVILMPVKHRRISGLSSEKTLSIRLANSIISAVKGISKIDTGKYPLMVDKLVIEMGIAASITGSIDAGFDFEILPLSVSEGGKYSRSNNNVLKIEFTHKK